MVDFKKVKAPNNTITRNPAVLAAKADNNIKRLLWCVC